MRSESEPREAKGHGCLPAGCSRRIDRQSLVMGTGPGFLFLPATLSQSSSPPKACSTFPFIMANFLELELDEAIRQAAAIPGVVQGPYAALVSFSPAAPMTISYGLHHDCTEQVIHASPHSVLLPHVPVCCHLCDSPIHVSHTAVTP